MVSDIYTGLLPEGYVFWEVEGERVEGKGNSPISTHSRHYCSVNFPKSTPDQPLPCWKHSRLPVTSEYWEHGHSQIFLVWPFLQLVLHTPVVPGLTVLFLISSSWQKESLDLELPWPLCLFWLTPIYPLCLSSGMASIRLPPQVPPAPLYLVSVLRIGKLSLKIQILSIWGYSFLP